MKATACCPANIQILLRPESLPPQLPPFTFRLYSHTLTFGTRFTLKAALPSSSLLLPVCVWLGIVIRLLAAALAVAPLLGDDLVDGEYLDNFDSGSASDGDELVEVLTC